MDSSATQTVSVLITDLVGSTAMADRLGPTSAEQLRSEHFELLRAALDRTGGREVKNLGDGLMVAFDSATQSLNARSTCSRPSTRAIVAHRSSSVCGSV